MQARHLLATLTLEFPAMVRYLPPRKAKIKAVSQPVPASATRRDAKKDGAMSQPKQLRFADGPTIIDQQTPARATSAPMTANAPTKSRSKLKVAAVPIVQLSFTFKSAKSLPALRQPADQSSTAKGAKRRSASDAGKTKATPQDAAFDGLTDLTDMACSDLEYYTSAIEDTLAASLGELGSSSGASPTRLFVEHQANSSIIPSYRDDSTCAENLSDQSALKLLVDAINAHEAGFLCNHIETRALSPGEQPVTVPADCKEHLDDASSVFMVVIGNPILLSVSGVSITLQPGSVTRLGLESAAATHRTVTPLTGRSMLITLRACSRFVDSVSGQVVNALQTGKTVKGKKGRSVN